MKRRKTHQEPSQYPGDLLVATTIGRPMTPRQLAAYLQVSLSTIQRRMKEGKIPYIRVGNQIRFVAADVITALRNEPK